MGLARTFETAADPAQKPACDALSALLALGRPLVMGILNVTPDSFSDGGRFIDPAKAIAQAAAMAEQGADILDIGAESTRPYGGATPVSADEETSRLKPILPAALKVGLPVSIDTIKASIAAWALDQGAGIVNDVWGLQRDADMAKLVAERGVPVIVMHNRERADRLRQDAGTEHRLHCAPFRIQTLRASAAGRRLTQALHQFGDAVRTRSKARRLDRQPSRSGEERRGNRARARRRRDRAGAARGRGHRDGTMSDRIFINGLSLHAYHGVMPHEAKVGQTFTIDLELEIDLSDAARSDKVMDTVSYDKVVDCASKAFCGQRRKLIETAAGQVASAVLSAFARVRQIKVTIHKPHAPIAATFSDVGVTLVRARGDDKS